VGRQAAEAARQVDEAARQAAEAAPHQLRSPGISM